MQATIAFKPAAPTPQLASARLRCYKPTEYLRAAGWDVREFDPGRMNEYRVVVFQKAYSEEDLQIAAHLRGLGVRTAFDLCDNHFVFADGRAERLRRMIDAVDAVSVATPELGKLIARPATVIDDALDDVPDSWWAEFRRRLPRRRGSPLRLIWYGNAGMTEPPFGLVDLARLLPDLVATHARSPITLTVVSNSRPSFDAMVGRAPFPVTYHEWDTAAFPRLFRRHHVCLIPVTINPFTVGKTVNRLALSLLLGVPAIADAIPSYDELRPFALFGDWQRSLERYANDADLRSQHVRMGRAYLRTKYTRQRVVEQWATFLRPLAA
ncbi:MAG: hypothetical protein U0746_19805 [Gemmataceae bacterium]